MKAKTPSFVCELPVRLNPHERKVLSKRFEAARHLYNACLGEALKRLDLMRESRAYQKARRLPRGKARTRAFSRLRERYGFREYDLHRFTIKTKNACWIADHLDAHTSQKLATRAYQAANAYALGKRGRPRFKGKGRLRSLEGKSNAAGIRYRDGLVLWRGLELRCLIDLRDQVQAHGLSSKVKYVRLVRKTVKGREFYYAQLVCEGLPYQKEKNALGVGVVGIDPGVSGVAAVGKDKAVLLELAPGLQDKRKEFRLLQRRMDRQRRAANPGNFREDGTVKPGHKKWRTSRRYIETRERLSELRRKEAEQRKTENNRIAGEVLRMGDTFKIEKNSYLSFQRNYGRSVGRRSPGGMIAAIASKAERAGGAVYVFPTGTTKLSRTCACGRLQEKPLSQRWHTCPCGITAQRDLMSAFLARFVDEENRLDAPRALEAWAGAEPLLRRAVSSLEDERASGRILPASFGVGRRQSPSPAEFRETGTEAGDDVAACFMQAGESPGEVLAAAGPPRALGPWGGSGTPR